MDTIGIETQGFKTTTKLWYGAWDSRTRPFHSLDSRVYLSAGLAKSWKLADVLYCMVYGVTGRPVERWRSVSETQGQGGGAVPSQGASAVPWSHSTLPSTAHSVTNLCYQQTQPCCVESYHNRKPLPLHKQKY